MTTTLSNTGPSEKSQTLLITKIIQHWTSGRCALQNVNLNSLISTHCPKPRPSSFTSVTPWEIQGNLMVCIPQHLLWPITNYMHVRVQHLPYWIQYPPFLHHMKTSLALSSKRCWNSCHSTRGLLVPPPLLFQLPFLSLKLPKGIFPPSKENPCKYCNETWPIQFSFAKSSGFPLLLHRAVNYPEIPFFKPENGSQ